MSENTTLKIYIVDGQPMAQKRPRWSGHHMYDEQREDKERIGVLLAEQHGVLPPYKGPLHLSFAFYMRTPKTFKYKSIWHVARPDVDNLAKFIMDICVDEGIIKDDSQVCKIDIIKQYNVYCRTEFTIRELE